MVNRNIKFESKMSCWLALLSWTSLFTRGFDAILQSLVSWHRLHHENMILWFSRSLL